MTKASFIEAKGLGVLLHSYKAIGNKHYCALKSLLG